MDTSFRVIPDYSLRGLNTLALPCRAEFFSRIQSTEALGEALAHARNKRLPITVIGGGSNIVLAGDIRGLVLQMAIPGIRVEQETDSRVWISVGAGEAWHPLVVHCLENRWYGLENLSLIPGFAGAAPIQNIGAYGVELSSCFDSLDAVEIDSGEQVRFSLQDCEFGYRTSVFKERLKDRFVITALRLSLQRNPDLCLTYPALREALQGVPAEELTPALVSETVCRIRREKLPDPAVIPNAGSFFKNPVVSQAEAAALRDRYPGLVGFPQAAGGEKLAAGWLLEQAGWKGYSRKGVGVHDRQALVLVNQGAADGGILLSLANEIQRDIRRKFGIALEMEPRILGHGSGAGE